MSTHYLEVAEFDPDREDPYEDLFIVEHPADCPRELVARFPDGSPVVALRCHVAMHEDNGIGDYFVHANDPASDFMRERVPTGRHVLEAWLEQHGGGHSGNPIEYDGGLRVVS